MRERPGGKTRGRGETRATARKAGRRAAARRSAGGRGLGSTPGGRRPAQRGIPAAGRRAAAGARPRPVSRRDGGFDEFVLDQLADLGGVEMRRMFGGAGLWRNGLFFGILWRGRLYLKTDEKSRERYRARKMKPFRPGPGATLGTYWEVPSEVVEDARALPVWAAEALGVERRR